MLDTAADEITKKMIDMASTFGSKALQDDQEAMARRAGALYVHAFACH
jgi:hypothetical protein